MCHPVRAVRFGSPFPQSIRTVLPVLCHPATLLLLVLGWPLAFPATAQPTAGEPPSATITGQVVDINGQPVPDAEVQLVDPRRRAEVDAEGRFRFRNLAPGRYLVEVESEVYGLGVERVNLGPGATAEVTITLDLSTFSDSVVISAGADPKSRLEVAQPVSVLTGEDLEIRLQPSLGETLSGEPGVSSTYFGPGSSRPVIRGLGAGRVRILEDGVGSLDASDTSADHAVSYDTLLAQTVEVVRGPATLLYGSSAVGGVINVLDERIPQVVPERRVSGEVTLHGGTVADEAAGAAHLEGGVGPWAWHAHASRRDTEDYEVPTAEGVLDNSALERESAGVGISRVGERGYLGISVSGFDTLYGVPGGEHAEEEGPDADEEEGGVRIDLEQRRLDLAGEWLARGGFLRGIKVRLGMGDYEHQELEGDEIGTRFENEGLEGRLELVQRRRGRLTGSFGVQVVDQDFSAVGEEAFVPPSTTESQALFAFQELEQGDDLRFQFGGRVESQTTDPRPLDPTVVLPERSFTGVSGSFGLVWDVSDTWSVATSLARTERLPSANELYADGPHLATRTFELGDPALDEEVSLGWDVSLRRKQGRLTGVFNLFVNRFDDFIFEAFQGRQVEGLDLVRFVQQDAEFRGGELDLLVLLSQQANRHLDLLLKADYVDAELRAGGENLPRIPPLSWTVGFNGHWGRLRGTVEARRVEEQDRVAANETVTDSYTLINASVSYRLFLGDFVTDLHLVGRNLGDEEARNHVSFLKEEVPLPGRDLTLSVRFKF